MFLRSESIEHKTATDRDTSCMDMEPILLFRCAYSRYSISGLALGEFTSFCEATHSPACTMPAGSSTRPGASKTAFRITYGRSRLLLFLQQRYLNSTLSNSQSCCNRSHDQTGRNTNRDLRNKPERRLPRSGRWWLSPTAGNSSSTAQLSDDQVPPAFPSPVSSPDMHYLRQTRSPRS